MPPFCHLWELKREYCGLNRVSRLTFKIRINPYIGRIRNIREDVKKVVTYKFVISRSAVQFRPLAPVISRYSSPVANSLELFEKAEIVFEEQANVIDAKF